MKQERRGFSVRAKVLACVLVVAGVGMVVGGLVSYIVQNQSLDARIDGAITQEVAEFRTLAADGVDPETGATFTSVQQLLVVALKRNVPGEQETYLALIDGKPFRSSGGERPFRPEREPEIMRQVAQLKRDSPVTFYDADTSKGHVHYAPVQVSITGEEAVGTYLIAYGDEKERNDIARATRTYSLICAMTLLVLGAVGWLVAGRMLRPLRLLREASTKVTEGDLSQRIPVRGRDDVSEVSRNFNAMLTQLESSFETQRRLIDDAGHELRTPLTIVRGHLELLNPRDPQETADTKHVLLDEVDRMSRMVEDMILLARSDRPDFLITGPIEVTQLTEDLFDKGRALGERKWHIDALASGWIEADAHRLTQAILQLMHNAVRYSSDGDVVAIGSRWVGNQLHLWVRDTGIGIPADQHDNIFRRFARIEHGRADQGSGLGLSIVSAIVAAHGGHIKVASEVGVGSTFTVVLTRNTTIEDLLNTPSLMTSGVAT